MCLCVFLRAFCPFLMCFTVSYESMLAYTIKAHPGAFKARTPLNAARSFNYYYYYYYYYYYSAVKLNVQPNP